MVGWQWPTFFSPAIWNNFEFLWVFLLLRSSDPASNSYFVTYLKREILGWPLVILCQEVENNKPKIIYFFFKSRFSIFERMNLISLFYIFRVCRSRIRFRQTSLTATALGLSSDVLIGRRLVGFFIHHTIAFKLTLPCRKYFCKKNRWQGQNLVG